MKPPTTENLGKLMIRFVLLLCHDVVGGLCPFPNPLSAATDEVAFFFFFESKSEVLQLLRGNNENASTALLLDDCNNDIATPLSKYMMTAVCISNSRCGCSYLGCGSLGLLCHYFFILLPSDSSWASSMSCSFWRARSCSKTEEQKTKNTLASCAACLLSSIAQLCC